MRFVRRPSGRDVACLLGLLVVLWQGGCTRNIAPAVDTSGNTVQAGDARFTFLTPSLVRMEYAPSGKFVDAPTAVVQKRDWPAVVVHAASQDGWLVANTDQLTVRYRLQSGAFDADNLEVRWHTEAASPTRRWHPGQVDTGNLGGLTYSLDNISKPNLPTDGTDLESPVNDLIPGIDVLLPKAKPGLLSRSGYAFIDDSATPVWNPRRHWIEPRQGHGQQDWYLFTYGDDYHRVLQEYAALCGPVPMIPRYTLGAWITDFNFEYFPGSAASRTASFKRYNAEHLKAEITRLRRNRIPLDGLVLDFAWHNYGWDGGFDWSPLIPHPQSLLDWLAKQGIKVSLNDHPGYANTEEAVVSHQDSHAAAALAALGQPVPPAPSFKLPLPERWQFALDPHDAGQAQHWYAGDSAAHWTRARIGEPWEQLGHKGYDGVAWYRTTMRAPSALPASLYLVFGEVGGHYTLYINGTQVAHSTVQWPQRLTYAEVAGAIRPGQDNTIVLRVQAGERGSGLIGTEIVLQDVQPPPRIFFDLSDQRQAAASMDTLHKPLLDQGVAFWWVDGGSGAVGMPGLNKQLWTNKVFYDATQQATGERGFILSRYGDWGSERYPAYFTGDTYSEWPVLAYEVAYTTRAGNVLVPWVSHDIGGFHGARIPFDLYARWVEFGTFSPILRLHSAHANPTEGNVRMPWNYGQRGIALLRRYFTLRTQLIPYIYSYAWQAHTQSLPLLRPLYLVYPDRDEAYRHPHEYFFGDQMLVAPVTDPSGDVQIYLPPGDWFDFFTGRRYPGGRNFTAHYAVDATPVFVRDGGIVVEQAPSLSSDAHPLDRVIVDVYGTAAGSFELYEDDGRSLDYRQGARATTPIRYAPAGPDGQLLTVGATAGSYRGQPPRRGYDVRFHTAVRPGAVSVDGRSVQWHWDPAHAVATVAVPSRDIRRATEIGWTIGKDHN